MWSFAKAYNAIDKNPEYLRAAKNIYAFVADVVMLLVSLPLCVQLDKTLKQHFPGLLK